MDREQFASISKKKEPHSKWFRSDEALRTIQILAIVIGGCWVFIQFLIFGREQSQLTNTSLQQAIDLTREQTAHERLKQLRTSKDLQQASVHSFRRDVGTVSTLIEDVGDGTARFDVKYYLSIENTSPSDSLEISFWILDYYIGDLPKTLRASKATSPRVRPLGSPGNRWNPDSDYPGALAWKREGTFAAITFDAQGKITSPWDDVANEVVKKEGMVTGGPMTGIIRPSEAYVFTEHYLVEAPKGAYVGFRANICFNRCSRQDDLYTIFAETKLPAALGDTIHSPD